MLTLVSVYRLYPWVEMALVLCHIGLHPGHLKYCVLRLLCVFLILCIILMFLVIERSAFHGLLLQCQLSFITLAILFGSVSLWTSQWSWSVSVLDCLFFSSHVFGILNRIIVMHVQLSEEPRSSKTTFLSSSLPAISLLLLDSLWLF